MEFPSHQSNVNEIPVVIWNKKIVKDDVNFVPLNNNEPSKESVSEEIKFSDGQIRISGFDRNNSLSSCNSCSKSKIAKKPKVPDGGWGWMVVFASFIISVIADGISFSFGLLYIEFLNYFGESKSKTSWIGSLFMAVPLLLGPIMSALVDKYGCRSMTMLGGLISSLGFVLASFGNSIEWELVFFGIIAGVGLGLCYVTAVVSIAYWFDKYRTLAIGLGACGTGVGTFVYAPLTQFLIEEYGWRGTVLLLAGTFLNMCVCGALMRDPNWLTEAQNKQVSLKNSPSCSKIRETVATSSVQNNKNINSLDYISTISKIKNKLTDCAASSKKNLPFTRSEVNLPTYLSDKEQIQLAIDKKLNNNKTTLPLEKDSGKAYNLKLFDPRDSTISEDLEKEETNTTTISANHSMPEEPIQNDASASSHLAQENTNSINQSNLIINRAPLGKEFGQHCFKDITLNRNSVMYRGAMLNIPRYRLRTCSCPDIFRDPVTTVPKENEEKLFVGGLELFKTMFDFSMFVEFHFLLMSLATIILFIWLIVPYFYLAEYVTRHGYTEVEASFLLSVIGVANCFGMVGLGWAGDQPWMNVTKTYAVCLILCGLTCVFMPVAIDSYYVLTALSALFGIFFSSNYSFTPSIVVQLISLERFTTAYGLILLCQGIGCLVGPPLAGWIFDLMGDWDFSFYLAGGCIIFSAFLTILIQYTENRRLWGSNKPREMTKSIVT